MALIFDDIEMSTPFPPELLLQCIVPSRHLVDEKSLITKLPRPLLGKVLEFVGEKRAIYIDCDRPITVLRLGRGGPIHAYSGGCIYIYPGFHDLYELMKLRLRSNVAYHAWQMTESDLDISHPRPNKYGC